MQPPQTSVESVFSRAWQLLTANWIIIVPGLAIGFIVGVVEYLLVPHYAVGDAVILAYPASAAAGLLGSLVVLLGIVLAQCYMTGMAGAAWIKGKTDLSDGARAFQRDAGNTLVAIIGMFLIGILAFVLAIPTLGIALLLYVYFLIYTFPAAIVGERPGFAAIGDSIRIASRRVGPTLIVVIIVAVVVACGAAISAVLSGIPLLGPIVGAMFSEAVLAYATLVVVGEYLALKDAAAP